MYNENYNKNMKKKIFDFRSDTVTIPTPEMLQEMIKAEVGDDVRNEDPTVHKLQNLVASLCNKESALFVCSGMMSNQIAIRTHITQNHHQNIIPQMLICDSRCHIFKYEMGGVAFHSGCQIYPIEINEPEGYITAEMIEKRINKINNLHNPITTIICLENTLNGNIFPIEEIKKIKELSQKYEIKMHLDGARLWNACIATGISMNEYTQYFDSISVCLSKGLGAPIGSVLVGSKSFIQTAIEYRKLFGGGWRQAGNLAAAGIYAINHHWKKMKEDHENAQLLYEGLVKLGFKVQNPQTNMLFPNSKPLNLSFNTIIEKINQMNEKEEEKNFFRR
jgi:threonine aldolase